MTRSATAVCDGALLGARIRTLDPEAPLASAVAWRDGTIVAVGSDDEIRPLLGPRSERFDGAGLTVTPGLTDSHVHPFLGTDSTRGVDLRDCRDLDAVRARLRAAAAELRDGEWLLGHSLGYDHFAAGAIHWDAVAEAAGERPLHIRFFDGHTDLANAQALAAAGVDGPRRFDSAAEVVCDAAGRPTGELRELAAMELVRAAIPAPTHAQRLAAYAATLRAMARVGLTGAHVMSGDRELLDVVAELEASGRLALRLWMPLRNEPETDDEEIALRLPLAGRGGRRWTTAIAKFFLDGVIESGTAWLLEPGPGGVNQAPFWSDGDRYAELVRRFTAAGFACVSHAVGEGAVRAALDAYAQAGPPRAGMHRVEHIEVLHDDDLPRFAALGVAASMQASHMAGLDDPSLATAWAAMLPAGARERGFRSGDLLRAGATLPLGSDWMVADYDPRDGMAWARLRRQPGRPDHVPHLPDQALDAAAALAGYTTAAAAVVGEPRAGRIAPGAFADLTAWAADPLAVDGDELAQVPIRLTVLDGEVTHREEG